MAEPELCGFLDAKLPGHRGRKRTLAPWKTWHRHWCTVRKLGPGLGVQVQLIRGLARDSGSVRDNTIKVPADSIISRTESTTKLFAFGIFPPRERKPLLYLSGTTESETQRWIANLRQLLRPRRHRFMEGTFDVSIVDNAHSRAAGLTGLHGDLVASRSGIFIKDVHSGEIIENFEWNEMNQFHLSTTGRPDDVKRICVIHTTKHFRAGVGEIALFCMNASKLLQVLVTQGRGPRRKNDASRPLSLSDGDLTHSLHQDDATSIIFPIMKSKAASSLINASLLLSTRSGSEARLGRNEFEKIDTKLAFPLRALDNLYEPAPILDDTKLSSRISNISLSSGIYEEILDSDVTKSSRVQSNIYENPAELIFTLPPPPLPPRQRCCSESTCKGSLSDDCLDSEDGTSPADEKNTTDDCHYMPMSPRLADIIAFNQLEQQIPAEEQVYMVMR